MKKYVLLEEKKFRYDFQYSRENQGGRLFILLKQPINKTFGIIHSIEMYQWDDGKFFDIKNKTSIVWNDHSIRFIIGKEYESIQLPTINFKKNGKLSVGQHNSEYFNIVEFDSLGEYELYKQMNQY